MDIFHWDSSCTGRSRTFYVLVRGAPQTIEAVVCLLLSQMGLESLQQEYVRLEELPFTSEQKWMAIRCVHRTLRVSVVSSLTTDNALTLQQGLTD